MITGEVVNWEEPGTNEVIHHDTEIPTDADVDVPVKRIEITLDQLLQVVKFGRLNTSALQDIVKDLTKVFEDLSEENVADVSALLLNPTCRDILQQIRSFELIDYRNHVLTLAQQENKLTDKVLI